jgi:hypothetical protein
MWPTTLPTIAALLRALVDWSVTNGCGLSG